jgi:hypothetical protein
VRKLLGAQAEQKPQAGDTSLRIGISILPSVTNYFIKNLRKKQ